MYHSKYSLDETTNLPDEAQLQMLQDLEHQRTQRLRNMQEFRNTLRQLRTEYVNELHALIDEQHRPTYLKLHERRIKQMRSLNGRPCKNAEWMKELKAKRDHNIEETMKLVKKAGIDPTKIRSIQNTFQQKVADAFRNRRTIADPVPIPAPETQSIFLGPPYQDHNDERYHDSSTGGVSCEISCDQSTGLMKYESHLDISDADDDDYAIMFNLLEFGKLCEVPSGCSAIALMATFENVKSTHHLQARDECGFSGFALMQEVWVHLKVKRVWPMGGFTTKTVRMDDFPYGMRLNDPNPFSFGEYWTFFVWEPGQTINTVWVDFPGPYSSGSYLGVWAGLEFIHGVEVNDYTIWSSMYYEQNLKGISVNFR